MSSHKKPRRNWLISPHTSGSSAMKSIDLRKDSVDLPQLLHLAGEGSVLIVTQDGHEYILAEADDFDAEVEALRKSAHFQSFLDQRMNENERVPIEEIERDLKSEVGYE